MASITKAFCIELDEIVTITDARREFHQRDPKPEKFNFLCANPECRAAGVPVSGANYRTMAEDGEKHQADHFRLFPQKFPANRHLPGCEWIDLTDDHDDDVILPDETEQETHVRRAKRKLHDFIDIFNPNHDTNQEPVQAPSEINTPKPNKAKTGESPNNRRGGVSLTRTSDLERLVGCYLEAKSKLSKEDFKKLTLQVQGIGRKPLYSYFKPLRYATTNTRDCVIYGGVYSKIERYGLGFKLTFYDKIEDRPVTLYVDSQSMKSYKYARYLEGILSAAENAQYFTVYLLGTLEAAPPSIDAWNLVIDNLSHLVIMPKFKKPLAPSDA